MNIMRHDGNDCYDEETLHELQAAELVILDEIARICDAHGLTWFLDAGTALGAARHGGFIPWDDDVDISLPRADYARFLQVGPAELPSWLRLDNPAENRHMSCLFSKVCLNGSVFATQETIDSGYDQGIFVDVFAYDLVAEDPALQARQLSLRKRATFLKYLFFSRNVNVPHDGLSGLLERTACSIAHVGLSRFSTLETIERLAAKSLEVGLSNAEKNNPLITMDYKRKPIRQSLVLPCGKALFEGKEYPVPASLDTFLSNIYGNWRELPPPDKQVTHKPLKVSFPYSFNS